MGFFSSIWGLDIGIDLGTSNIVVYVKGKGIILNEPSMVALRRKPRGGGQEIIAVGMEAKRMDGKTPTGIETIWPLKDGVIANFEMTEELLRYCIQEASEGASFRGRPRVAISVPAEITEVERKAVIDATLGAGAKEAYVVEEPISAALGVGLPIEKAQGCMIIDIGGGTSEVSVLSLGGAAVKKSERVAGRSMDEAIINLLRQHYALLIGNTTAEEIKNTIGSVLPLEDELTMEVRGRDLSGGLPRSIHVSSIDVREALEPIIARIEDAVKVALEHTKPELAKDIASHGIFLTGGVANIKGLAERFAKALKTPVFVADEPLFAVAYGLGKYLDDLDQIKGTLLSVQKGAR